MIFKVIFVLLAVGKATGVIYRLNETEYDRLPALYLLEPYHPCLRARGGLYCYVEARLVSDEKNDLLSLIEEYSAYTKTHYNHSVVHRGLCVTQSCRDQLGNSSTLGDALEACLNDTLYDTHQLKVKLIKERVYCTEFDEEIEVDAGDYAVAVVVATLLLLNLLGSLYDFWYPAKDYIVSKLLLAFSVKRNWQRLVMPSGEGPEPRLRRLKSFNGLKALTTMLVILGHSPLSIVINTNNPQHFESTYHNPLFHFFYNGTLIVQTFFLISGFLLAYNILIMEEKRKVNWKTLPSGVFLRWLRLTPVYAVVLALMSTWFRHTECGPLWKSTVGVEVEDCRRDWYYHILYYNNYVDNSQCIAQTWYLAADMQLSVVGLVVFCLLRQRRQVAVAALVAVGLVTPALYTYLKDLHAVLIVSPEVVQQYFVTDPTFNNLYKRGHTNIVCYALGMALGMLVHRLQNTDFDLVKYKKYRPVYWALVPIMVGLIMSGGVFYVDGVEVPLGVRAVYSSGIKLVFGFLIFVLVGGLIFKFENVYRGILEWHGWAAVGRVSYCAYLIHMIVIRTSMSNQTSLVHFTSYQVIMNYLGVLAVSFVLAVPCWMLVEAPVAQLIKVTMSPGQKTEKETVTMPNQFALIGSKETI